MRKERTKYEFSISVGTVSQGLATIDTSTGIDDGLRRKLEKSELMLSDANRELASLKVALEAAQKSESAAKVNANEANRHTADIQDKITAFNRTIDQLQLDLSAAQANAENAESRSDRLSRRVNELEHQLSERAVELAKILGDSKASSELSSKIELSLIHI